MSNFRIFSESKADIKFLKDYIEEILHVQLSDNDFDPLGSWSDYKAGGSLKASIKQNHYDDQKTTILILDADNDFEARREEILEDFGEFEVPVSLFLFPNNNSAGNIESLLATIGVDQKLMTCFLEYETCVRGYNKPLNHSRIYAYLDLLLDPNHLDENNKDLRREEYRNYRNAAHWNLNHAYLTPLREFLQPFFTP